MLVKFVLSLKNSLDAIWVRSIVIAVVDVDVVIAVVIFYVAVIIVVAAVIVVIDVPVFLL